MPREPHYIKTPAVIRKTSIGLCAELKGKVNATEVLLDSKKYRARTLRFAAFAGALMLDDSLYHGFHLFEEGDWKESETADLRPLLVGATQKVVVQLTQDARGRQIVNAAGEPVSAEREAFVLNDPAPISNGE